jgi:hypothetical protein
LLAVAVGADVVAVADLAAVVDAAGAVAGAAVVAAVDGLDFVAFCIPPWPLQVPLPVDVVVVPSEQVVVAPAAGAAGVFAAGAAAGAAGAAGAAFCTPPWPLQVPLPVEVVVVPSMQVVVAVSAARLGIANAQTNRGAAMRLATAIFFMNLHSLGLIRVRRADCNPIFSECDRPSMLVPKR